MIFKKDVEILAGGVPFHSSEEEISDEPMIYGGSWDWCRKRGGSLTNLCMDMIEPDVKRNLQGQAFMGYHPVIDTKSVLLMAGQYPCIPGWHCDGVIRSSRGAQPNLETINEPVIHYICSVSDNSKNHGTEFAETTNIPESEIDREAVWSSVDRHLNGKKDLRVTWLESGQIARMTRSTLHRGPAANERGWRYFFRLSFYHMPAMNQIRKQVQVYADPAQGW